MPDIPDYPDDFSNYPETLTSRKANKVRDMKVWTPRDAIIDALRDIDSLKDGMRVDVAIVCWREVDANGATYTRFCQSGPDIHTTIGLMETTKDKILHND